jgi:hypothetical protein
MLLSILEFTCTPRDDCYYTDSVVLSYPEGFVSSTELGKFKLEHHVKEGISLAHKSYCLIPYEGSSDILVHKGAAKEHVTREWYINQYTNRTHIESVTSS